MLCITCVSWVLSPSLPLLSIINRIGIVIIFYFVSIITLSLSQPTSSIFFSFLTPLPIPQVKSVCVGRGEGVCEVSEQVRGAELPAGVKSQQPPCQHTQLPTLSISQFFFFFRNSPYAARGYKGKRILTIPLHHTLVL